MEELDFLKFVFITLMIAFHLTYIGDTYPVAKQLVYTFHMPGFLLVSGYLFNVNKSWTAFGKTMLWIFIPYTMMESGYTVMASLLPIREHINHLTVGILIDHIFLHPMGPYWYLHTLMLCGTLGQDYALCPGPLAALLRLWTTLNSQCGLLPYRCSCTPISR